MCFLGPVVRIWCQALILPAYSHTLGLHTRASTTPEHTFKSYGLDLKYPLKVTWLKATSLQTRGIGGTGVICRRWRVLAGESGSLEACP